MRNISQSIFRSLRKEGLENVTCFAPVTDLLPTNYRPITDRLPKSKNTILLETFLSYLKGILIEEKTRNMRNIFLLISTIFEKMQDQ